MNDDALEQRVAAASAYEALFVPALFREWAPRVASAAGIEAGQRVLDVACGTGVLAREVAARVGAGSVTGVDIADGMLAVAARLAPAIAWRQAAAESLPFADRSFDRVVSQFGLMFFSQPRRAIGEMLRVLAPGGRLTVAVWDALARAPAYAAQAALLERLAGRAAADAVRAPFALGERAELAALFEGAGEVTITSERGVARFPSVRSMVEADLRGWLPLCGVNLEEEQIARILDEAEHVLAPFVTPRGDVRFDISAHIASATR